MTMFIKIENGEPVGHAVVEENFRMLFPDVNFPKIFFPHDVEPYGFGIYEFTQVPDVEYPDKRVEISPELRSDGVYYQTWAIVEMSDDEKTQATETQANTVRVLRNMRLLHCDWTQGKDAPLTVEQVLAWAMYRQELRDITTQTGFPWSVVWPTEPTGV